MKGQRFTITELAQEFGITARAIRYYEEVGLLSPHRETPTSRRLYDEGDRARLKLILRGKRFGYSLSELRDILDLYDVDRTQRKQIMRTLELGLEHIRDIDERVGDLLEIRGEMLEFAGAFLEILEKGDGAKDTEMRAFIDIARKRYGRLADPATAPRGPAGMNGIADGEGDTALEDGRR